MESLSMITPRDDDDDVVYYNPSGQIYAGLWSLFGGATVFLGLRLWSKYMRRHGLWYDDYVLISAYIFLMITNIIITIEYATGYSSGSWDDRMHILINTSSIGTVIGQAVSKTAFAVTLIRMVESRWQLALLWFCIITMDGIAFSKCIFQWAKLCGDDSYQQWYRLQGWCLNKEFQNNWKEIGNIYNIIMDFIFALFPWFLTWRLKLKRAEKIALCATLSLGIVVAIITAVRTWWKDTPLMHVHDRWYMWRDAMSEIWYSAEVAGTIIVQCIPVLRPFIKDLHTSLTSRKLAATEPTRDGSTWRGSTLVDTKRQPASQVLSAARDDLEDGGGGLGKQSLPPAGIFELTEIPEEEHQHQQYQYQQHATINPLAMSPSMKLKLGNSAEAYRYDPRRMDESLMGNQRPARQENWPL